MKDMQNLFAFFATKGIRPMEVQAAVCCLTRELTRKPTLKEVAAHLDEYLKWRETEKGRRLGELTVAVTVTELRIKTQKLRDSFTHGEEGGEQTTCQVRKEG